MVEISSSPQSPGPAKGFLRSNWAVMTGITAVIATVGFPLVTVVRNNEAEYQATGDFGALFGHPFDSSAHYAFKAPGYGALIAQHPDLKLSPDDAPEIRTAKISAINNQALARINAEKDAATLVQKKMITGPEEANATILQNQFQADAQVEAYNAQGQAMAAMRTTLNNRQITINDALEIYSVPNRSQNYLCANGSLPQNYKKWQVGDAYGYLSTEGNNDIVAALNQHPTVLPAGNKTITPCIYGDSDERFSGLAAWTTNSSGEIMVLVDIDEKIYGFISKSEYLKLGGPPLGPAYSEPEKS